MAKVIPFPALKFTEKAGDISKNVCPPYDIISQKERGDYVNDSPCNIIRLELPVGENAYANACALYKSMRKEKLLDVDTVPAFYVYEEEFEVYGTTKKIKGIFARVKLEEFSEKVILPHEETLSKAKDDRFNLMCATYCNFSPIYSMYTDEKRVIPKKIDELTDRKPDIEFTAKDGVIQRLWVIPKGEDTDFIEKEFERKQLFIADGHHRYETALNFKKKLISDGVIKDENHPANYVMMMLIDMENDGLVVFPTHRIIKGLHDFNLPSALEKIGEYFNVCEIPYDEIEKSLAENDGKKAFILCAKGGGFYLLTLNENEKAKAALDALNPGKSPAYKNLDVTVLHSLILEKIFGIDKENMANQINLKYTRDVKEAVNAVKDADTNCAFLIKATRVKEIKDVSLAFDKMPQKSTYFYPKLITGLVMNELASPDSF